MKKKLFGLAFIIISIAMAMIDSGDITASVLLLPFGIWIMFTRQKVFYDGDKDT